MVYGGVTVGPLLPIHLLLEVITYYCIPLIHEIHNKFYENNERLTYTFGFSLSMVR